MVHSPSPQSKGMPEWKMGRWFNLPTFLRTHSVAPGSEMDDATSAPHWCPSALELVSQNRVLRQVRCRDTALTLTLTLGYRLIVSIECDHESDSCFSTP